MKFIYCRGGDMSAPSIAEQAGMAYGVRYDYKAYAPVYMLDAGLSPRWAQYIRKVRQLKPTFALTPDLEIYRDIETIKLHIADLRAEGVQLIGVAPKYAGALALIPDDPDIVICISIPTQYSGYLPVDDEIRPGNYHLLGGDPVAQAREIQRITRLGGTVISADGNKLAMKAAHGQIFQCGRWIAVQDTTQNNARISAQNIMEYINGL